MITEGNKINTLHVSPLNYMCNYKCNGKQELLVFPIPPHRVFLHC